MTISPALSVACMSYLLEPSPLSVDALCSTVVEELLRVGFKPTRTFVLAYGIDEERGGISVLHI